MPLGPCLPPGPAENSAPDGEEWLHMRVPVASAQLNQQIFEDKPLGEPYGGSDPQPFGLKHGRGETKHCRAGERQSLLPCVIL